MTIYQRSAVAEPDSEFVPGQLTHLVVGNRGRLLDDRRTPIVLTGVDVDTGMFELEVAAFEDRGARWRLPFEDISKFQFARDAARVADTGFVAAVARFDRPLRVDCDHDARRATLACIADLAGEASLFLRPRWSGALALGTRHGDTHLFGAAEAWLNHRGVADMDRAFAQIFVSNPNSGELVKGHAIVAAELGLCPYVGKIVRSPDLFSGDRSRQHRADHLISRLALMRAIFTIAGIDQLTLYRGLASDARIEPARSGSFVSVTFAREVAEAHFGGGPTTVAAALYRQRIPVDRLLMTYLETPAMNAQYAEAEAILLGEPNNPLF
jgi:hypothetical protein